LDILCEAENIDAILTIITPQMMTDMAGTARVLGKYKTPKIFPVFMGGDAASPARKILAENGLVNFDFSSDVIRAFDRLSNFKKEKKKAASANALAQMPFAEASVLLSAYGIEVNGAFVAKKEDLGAAVSGLGSGPYALKSFSPDAVHKTEAGAVQLNLLDMEQLYAAWDEMDRNIEGMLVQKMGKGKEIIIGMKRDATFGPTILFGLGGIFTEVLQDTVLRVAPLSKDEALEMMREVKGKKILEGTRGEKPVNFDALADFMVNLSHLALEHPEIKEIDLNPVICSDRETVIVDARIMV
jgi:acetyl-CoA synthetase (ADP-forming)